MEAFYKLVYDISCYYAFAAFFLSYGMEYDVPAYSFLLFITACFLAVYAEKLKRFSQAIQIGAFLLPIIPFFLETNTWGKLVLLLPWTYLVMTVLRQGYTITYRRFKKMYLTIFWIYTAMFAFFVAEDTLKGGVAMIVTIPFLVILLVSGVFLLQMLRFQAGAAEKKGLEKYQRKQLVAFMIAATLLTIGNIVELLYVYVLYPLSELVLGAAMAVIVYIVSKLDSPLKPPKEIGDMGKSLGEFFEERQEILDNVETIWGKIPEGIKEEAGKEPDYTPVFIGLAIVAAIVIFAVMFGDKSKKKKQAAIEDEREDCFEEVTLKEVLKKRFVRPEIIIRYYYREFMKKSEAKKHKLEISDTTKEILVKYQEWNNATPKQAAEAKEATALYQKTRYSKTKMTQTDARRMKALVKGL